MSIGLIDAERGYDRPRSDGAALVVSLNGTVVQTVSLSSRPLKIGRLPENGLVLPDPSVSRQHAEVRLEDDGRAGTVIDLGSSGGIGRDYSGVRVRHTHELFAHRFSGGHRVLPDGDIGEAHVRL